MLNDKIVFWEFGRKNVYNVSICFNYHGIKKPKRFKRYFVGIISTQSFKPSDKVLLSMGMKVLKQPYRNFSPFINRMFRQIREKKAVIMLTKGNKMFAETYG